MAAPTRLQDKCTYCGKVAVASKDYTVTDPDETKPDTRFVHLKCGHLQVFKIKKPSPYHTLVSNMDNNPLVRACAHEWVINQCQKCREYKLYPFQCKGASLVEHAIEAGFNGAGIFDDVGLGKTVQALAYLYFNQDAFPVCYVVKSGLFFQWAKEILRWHGDMYAPQIIERSDDLVIPGLKSYIISYDLLVPKVKTFKSGATKRFGFDAQKLIDAGIKTLVLDECQKISNSQASRTKQIRFLAQKMQVIPLSATPWKNRGQEYFPVLNMIAPQKFPTEQGFLNNWVDYYWSGNRQKQGGIANIPKFKEYIKDFVIRREMHEVFDQFPSVNRTLYHCQMSAIEQKEYDASVSEFVAWYNDKVLSGEDEDLDGMHILAKMSRMRHIAGLAKIPATEEFVEDFIQGTDRKLVVFVHHQDVGSILFDSLKKKYGKDMLVLALTSAHDPLQRFQIQEQFNNAPRALLVASTLASGEGINLQTCADAILHERQWNPQNEDQAAPGRFRRINQTAKQVNVTFITAQGTIDEYLAAINNEKRAQFHATMNTSEAITWSEPDMGKMLGAAIAQDWNKANKKWDSIGEKGQVSQLQKWMQI